MPTTHTILTFHQFCPARRQLQAASRPAHLAVMATISTSDDSAGSLFAPNDNATKSAPLKLSRQAIIWLSIISAIVFFTFVTVIWLLCRCTCLKKRRRRSKGILDNRNDFEMWNRSGGLTSAPMASAPNGIVNANKRSTVDSFLAVPPARIATTRTTRSRDNQIGDAVIVDDAAPEPVYRERSSNMTAKKGSRYYGRWSERLSRFSQIGVAK